MIDKPDKFVNGPSDNTPSYVDCIKMKKIKNITPEICYIMQLSQIPTISSTIAKNIQKHYPTMRSLINVLNDTSDKVNLLCEIEKVGKEKAKKILDFFNY
tara:strand:+ start:152 stop:451 length:300 start_codon:yes stop_codon:yes gene_type:complete